MVYSGANQEYFELNVLERISKSPLKAIGQDLLTLLWFTSDENQLSIDGRVYSFNENDIISLTHFHNVEIININKANSLRFNKSFYCVIDHDSEVGCKGILYYGAAKMPIIKVEGKYLEILDTAWRMAFLELEMKDDLQLEMLQMMLKRILILCTRLYKNQNQGVQLTLQQHNLIREFNYLVEEHFRERHMVADYAKLLLKSPKTITNTFKKLGEKSPRQFIQDRILLEAQRMLNYSDKDISDIGYELGFPDIQSFSRFFKKQAKVSPSAFRDSN